MEDVRMNIGSLDDYHDIIMRICSLNEQLREHMRMIVRAIQAVVTTLEFDIPKDGEIRIKPKNEEKEKYDERVAFYARVRDDMNMFRMCMEGTLRDGKIFRNLVNVDISSEIPDRHPQILSGVEHRYHALIVHEISRTVKHVNRCIRTIASQQHKNDLAKSIACIPLVHLRGYLYGTFHLG